MSTMIEPRTVTGRMVLMAMLGFFGVIIAVNVVMMSFALTTDNGLVVRNSYVASQDFNRNAAEARRQDRLGWSMAVDLQAGEIIVRMSDGQGALPGDLTVTAMLGRPVTDHYDQALKLQGGDGIYRAPVTAGPGTWQVDVRAEDGEGRVLRRIWRFDIGAEQ